MERNLAEWCESYHTDSDVVNLFVSLDNTMKYVHDNSHYITNFNPENILVGENDFGVYTVYQKIAPLDDSVTDKINSNIYNLAFLEVGLLSSTLLYLTPQFLKENFSKFTLFLPSSLVSYYQRVLVNRGYFYLTDYLKTVNKTEISKINKSLEEDKGGLGSGKRLSKATAVGKAYREQDDVISFPNKDNNVAAFVTSYLLPFIIISISLLIPLMAFLVGLS